MLRIRHQPLSIMYIDAFRERRSLRRPTKSRPVSVDVDHRGLLKDRAQAQPGQATAGVASQQTGLCVEFGRALVFTLIRFKALSRSRALAKGSQVAVCVWGNPTRDMTDDSEYFKRFAPKARIHAQRYPAQADTAMYLGKFQAFFSRPAPFHSWI